MTLQMIKLTRQTLCPAKIAPGLTNDLLREENYLQAWWTKSYGVTIQIKPLLFLRVKWSSDGLTVGMSGL